MADYVNGPELTAELRIYRAAYLKSVELGEEKPQISDKISNAIIQIATRLSSAHNFNGYSFIEEMKGDAILKCFSKMHNFNPDISENSFAYVTQISWQSFVNRIKIEQGQSSVKAKMIREKMSSEFVEHGVDSDSDDGSNAFVEFLKENDSYIDYNEIKKLKPVEKTSMVHRNKTPYKKKEVVPLEIPVEFDLSIFEEEMKT